MKSFIAVTCAALMSLSLAGCTTAEQTAAAGAATGAVAGALISGNARGAAVGAVVGGASGYVIGRLSNGNCRYRAADGSTYIARCPQ